MSREIDERIVQMKFDNTLFERNVATSIGTLEKLKSALDFSGATSSLSNIENNINKADFSKLASSIETISNRFSNWGIVGMTVIQDLTRAAENLGSKLLNMTFGKAFDQIQTGGWSRATNIDKAKFAIEGLGYAWDDLKGSIDSAVTDTRFGFDEAATAASQLVASNVAIGEEMDNALKSIANVASQTGDEYSSIAHIYTTIAGNGKLMTEQLNMFSYRGLNAAALIAKSMGKTEQEIREMTTKGEISFKQFSDAMNDALGEGAKRANETFEGSLANMKAALSRMGQPFAEVIRKQMPPVFNDLKELIKKVKVITDPLAEVLDDILSRATLAFRYIINNIDLTPLKNMVDLISTFAYQVSGIIAKVSPIWGHIDEDLTLLSKPIKEATEYYSSFASMLLDKKDAITKIPTSALEAIKKVAKEADDSYDSLAATILRRREKLFGIPTSAFEDMKKIAKDANKYFEEMTVIDIKGVNKKLRDEVTSIYDTVKDGVPVGKDSDGLRYWILQDINSGMKANEVIKEIAERFDLTTEEATRGLKIVQDAMQPTGRLLERTKTVIDDTSESISKTTDTIEHIDEVARKVLKGEYGNGQARIDKLEKEGENWKLIQNRVNELTGSSFRYEVEQTKIAETAERTSRRIAKVVEKPKTALDAVKDMVNALTEKVKEFAETIDKNSVIKRIATIITGVKDGLYVIVRIFSVFVNAALKPTLNFLYAIGNVVLDTWAAISELTSEFRAFVDASEILIDLEGSLNFIFGMISNLGQSVLSIFSEIAGAIGYALLKVNGFTFIYSVVDLVMSLSEKVIEIIDDVKSTMDKDAITDKIAAFLNGVIDGLSMVIRLASVVLNAAIKPLSALFITIGGAVLDGAAAIGEWITNVRNLAIESGFFEKLEVILNSIFWFISNIGQGIVKGIGGAFQGISNVISRVKETFDVFKDTDAFKSLSKSIADLKYDFNDLKTKGANLIEKIFGGFGGKGIKLPTGVFEGFLNVLTRISETVSGFISKVVDKFDVDAFLNGVVRHIDTLKQLLPVISSTISGTFSTAFNFVINIFTKLFGVIGNVIQAVKNLWGSFKESGALSAIGKGFESFKESIISIPKKIANFKSKISKPLTTFVDGFKPKIEKLVSILKNAFSSISKGLQSVFSKIDVKSVLKKVLNVLSNIGRILLRVALLLSVVLMGAIIGAIVLIKKFIGVIKNLGGRIKKLWGTFKETKAFKKLKDGFDSVKEKAISVKDKIVDVFTNDETGEFEFPKITWDGVKQTWFNIWDWIKEKFFAAKAWVEEKITNITGKEFHFPELNLEPIKEQFGKIKDWFVDLFTNDETGGFELPIDAIKQKFKEVKGYFINLFTDEETGEVKFSWDGLKQAFDDAILWVTEKRDAIVKLIKSVFGGGEEGSEESVEGTEAKVPMLERLKAAFDEAILWVTEKVDEIKKIIGSLFGSDKEKNGAENQNGGEKTSLFQQFKEALPELEDIEQIITKLGNIILIIQGFKAYIGILESVFQIGGILRQVKGTLRQFKGVVKAYKKEIKAEARELNARALLEIAAAIGIVALSFKLLSGLTWDQVAVGATCIGVITLALAALFALANSSQGKGLDAWQTAITTALTALGNGIKKVGSGLAKIGIAAIIVAITYAVSSIIGLIKDLTDYPWSDAKNSLKIIGAVLAELVGAVVILNLLDFGSFGRNLGAAVEIVAFAEAVKMICDTMITISKEPLEDLKAVEPIIIAIMAILAVCVGGMDLLSNDSIWQRLGSAVEIIAFAYGIKLIADALIELSNTPVNKLESARNAIALVLAAMAAVIAAMTGLAESARENLLGAGEALVSAVGVVLTVVGAFYLLKDMDPNFIESAGIGLAAVIGAISALMLAINEIVKASASGAGMSMGTLKSILGEAGIAAVITAVITGVTTILGQIEGLDEKLEKGAKIAEDIGSIIGRLIGGLLGGFIDALADETFGSMYDDLMSLPSKLSDFVDNLNPFLEKIKGLDSSGAEALLSIIGSIAACFGAELLGSLVEGLLNTFSPFGRKDDAITSFGKRLKAFGEAIAEYSEAVDGKINVGAVRASANAGKILTDLEGSMSNEGGFLSKIVGDNNKLDKLAERIIPFAYAMVAYSAIVDGRISEEAVASSARAGQILIDLEGSMENEGGVAAWWLGDNNHLDDFGDRIKKFAYGIRSYCNIVAGHIDEDAVESSARAGEVLAKLEGITVPQDGLLQEIMGSQSLDDFGTRIIKFGRAMRRYSGIVANHIDEKAVEASGRAGDILSSLEAGLTAQDGIKEIFSGGSGLDDFGGRLERFASSLVLFSDMITGNGAAGNNAFDNAAVSAAIATMQQLWDFVERAEGTSDTGAPPLTNFWEALTNGEGVIMKLKEFYEMLGADVLSSDTVDGSGVIENFTEAGKNLSTALLDGITNSLSEVDKAKQTPILKIMLTALSLAFNDRLLNNARNKGKSIGVSIVEGLETILTEESDDKNLPAFAAEVVKCFEDMIYNIFVVMTNYTPNFKTRAEAWMNSIKNAINLHRGTIIGSLLGIATTVLNNYGLRNPDFYSAGANWMTSLSNGISNNMNSVIELAQSVADQVSSIINNATNKASTASKGIGSFTDAGGATSFTRSSPMLTQMSTIADAGLRSANTLSKAMDTATSNGEMNFMQLQSLASFQNGAANLTRDMGSSMSMASQSIGRASSLFSSASSSEPATSEVYVKNNTETLEALNGMRRDIKVLTENMANMQMVLDSGVLVGQLTPGMNVSLNQRMKFKGRWA